MFKIKFLIIQFSLLISVLLTFFALTSSLAATFFTFYPKNSLLFFLKLQVFLRGHSWFVHLNNHRFWLLLSTGIILIYVLLLIDNPLKNNLRGHSLISRNYTKSFFWGAVWLWMLSVGISYSFAPAVINIF